MKPLILAIVFVFLAACAGELGPDRSRSSHLDPDRTGCEITKPSPPPKAKADEARRLFQEGERFALGDGVPRDDDKAENLFQRAIEADPSMGSRIAGLYDSAHSDRPRDLKKAILWYEQAAEREDGNSLFRLGYLYHYGEGVPIDLEKAFDYFSKAAAAGDVSAHNTVGDMYSSGKGRPVNYELARKHYLLAAGCGDEFAMQSLGEIYAMGLGTERNQGEALRWFAKAMQAGELQAIATPRTVAKMYRDGLLEASDRAAMALSWLLVATIKEYGGYGPSYEKARIEYLKLPRGTVKTAFEEAETLFKVLGLDVAKLRALEREFMSQ